MTDHPEEPLSPAGQARRAAMLGELTELMRQTHHRRRLRRRVLAAGGCVCVLGGLLWAVAVRAPVQPNFTTVPPLPPPPGRVDSPPERPICVTVIVQTDQTVLERCRPEPAGHVQWLDDAALLRTLASVNRPAGLIRFGGRVRLTAPVTDAELGL